MVPCPGKPWQTQTYSVQRPKKITANLFISLENGQKNPSNACVESSGTRKNECSHPSNIFSEKMPSPSKPSLTQTYFLKKIYIYISKIYLYQIIKYLKKLFALFKLIIFLKNKYNLFYIYILIFELFTFLLQNIESWFPR